ncbi:MAG: nucleotidyltransferase domain-containing protein [Roseburia sp.]|nr:nucleotidyltransferase domain-containing protein [Anaeroplasma bactoclasticum]MCM1197085.1 nucleotidyltransferase domain-containing protein [Roseburia sp.]MCM1557835.1 nucleotidyltransferase domain-containing protein [Anaeroplasma bactoclasticum]
MLLKNKEYNPKLDYLLCKYLLKDNFYDVDENHLKDCFFKKRNCKTDTEVALCKIRDFFLEHNLLKLNQNEIQMFLDFLDMEYSFQGFIGYGIEEKIFHLILSIKDRPIEEQEWILKFLLVVAYVSEKEDLILPYIKGIRRLLMVNSKEEIRDILSYLEKKTNRLNTSHDERLNPILPKLIKDLSLLFLEITGYLGIGIYGSFANHTSNSYSDLDIMVFISDGVDKVQARKTTKQFFCKFIPIPIDVKVTTEEEMDIDLTMGMKKTIKIIRGDIKWKN